MVKVCLICGDSETAGLSDCTEPAFEKIKEFCNEWHQLGRYTELHEKLTTLKWSPQHYSRHAKCYNKLTHSGNLNKLRTNNEKRIRNENAKNAYDITLCFSCQRVGNSKTSTVSSTNVAQDIVNIKDKGSPEVRSVLEAFGACDVTTIMNKIKYHPNCLNTEKRNIYTDNHVKEEDKYGRVNFEFLKSVKVHLTAYGENSPTMDINELVNHYEKLLAAEKIPSPVATMKRYIKTLMESDEDLMSKIDFYHFDQCKPTVAANKLFVSKLVCQTHFEVESMNLTGLPKSVIDIRKEISSIGEWHFEGSFGNYKTPQKLLGMVKQIIAGSHQLSEKKQSEVDVVSNNISQYICSNFKSDGQLNYQSDKNRGFEKHRITPFSVGIALVSYQANRSKTEIENWSRMGLCINYDKLERMITSMAVSLVNAGSSNGLGIVLPPKFKKGVRPIFAADNIDFGSDSKSFHGADLMVVQDNRKDEENLFPVEANLECNRTQLLGAVHKVCHIKLYECSKNCMDYCTRWSHLPSNELFALDRFQEYKFDTTSQDRRLPYSLTPQIDENVFLTDENDTRYKCPIAITNAPEHWSAFERLTIIWLLTSKLSDSADNESYKALSWSSFHSTLSTAPTVLSNVAIVAPLYRRSPTETPVLIDILKRAMGISVLMVGPKTRTIITLDGDLYNNAVKVPKYKEKWIIRLGSLHTIIAALKCLGKYIDGSGIDTAWEASGMYGTTTINQIIEGRHIYRGIHAHTVTLMALYSLHLESILSPEEQNFIQSLPSVALHLKDQQSCIESMQNIEKELVEAALFEKLRAEADASTPTAVFLCNYMRQVLNLLNYVGATRTRNWMQHLACTETMSKYFHAHDQTNYLKWTLLYLADMLELQTDDPDSWTFLEGGNFAVSKNEVPFTSIDPDHAIEHEHRPMKMKGGFVNITCSESALDRYTLILPLLGQLSEEYKRHSSVKEPKEKAKVHHEMYGNFHANQLSKAEKLAEELSSESNPFTYTDLRNLMNFSVPSDSVRDHILRRDQLGEELVSKFRKERMSEDSTIGFWSKYSRKNYKMFSDKEIHVSKVKSVVTSLKEEKIIYSRMMILSRTLPHLCPENVIGEHEMTNIPPSNFSPNGTMVVAKCNEQLIDLIMEMPSRLPQQPDYTDNRFALIVDGMDLLESLKTEKTMRTVNDLANAFMSKLSFELNRAANYSEVRLLFPLFKRNSLSESRSSEKHSSLKNIRQFHVSEKTPIKKLNQFLAHIESRIELTEFLGKKVLERFGGLTIGLVVSYGNMLHCNDQQHWSNILNTEHNLEEVTQLVLINAVDMRNNGIERVFVKTTSIDTLVVLLGHKDIIPLDTVILRNDDIINVNDFHSRIGMKLARPLIGWYSMQGMTNQGAFFGKGIKSNFRALQKCDDQILEAFANFGETPDVSENIIIQMERYTALLYTNRCDQSIKDVRFFMSTAGKDGKILPPTMGTLIPHVYRAHYSALVHKFSITLHPDIPHPTKYYWNQLESTYQAVMCINDALPPELMNFKQCNCKANTKRCAKLSCICVKAGLKCTELCKCGEPCENIPVEEPIVNEDEEDLVEWDGSI